MASTPKPYVRADGTVTWKVRFRIKPGSNPTAETFDTPEAAHQFAKMVDLVGGEAARAARDASDNAGIEIMTLSMALEKHLTEVATHATTGTVAEYRRVAERTWLPALGALPITAITRDLILQWVTSQRETETLASIRARNRAQKAGEKPPEPKRYSSKSIRNAHALLSSVLQQQVRDDVLQKNVAKGVPLPKDGKRSPVFLTQGEFAEIINFTPVQWQTFILLLAGTGMRWGEATALHVGDLDLESRPAIVRVDKAWKYGADGYYIGPPKTARGTRTISLPASLIPELEAEIEGVEGDQLVFTGPRGGRLKDAYFHEKVWQPLVQNLPAGRRPRIHDLRHSHASWLIASGLPLPVIQRRLGHESIQTTVDVYGHLAPDAYAGAAEAADLALAQALPTVGEIEG